MKGFVKTLNSKDGIHKGRKWVRYSFITEDEQGNESGWVTYGFEKPPFVKGDFIEYDFTTDDRGYKQVTEGTGRVVANAPKPAAAKPSASVSGTTTDSPGNTQATGVDRQTAITLQHSQEMAISTVALLLANDALPMSGAKTKAGEAKRFEEIVASIDKFTVKFHNDVATARLLSAVADMGIVSTAPDAPLPAAGGSASTGEY